MHEASQPPDTPLVHGMSCVLKLPDHLPNALEQGGQDLLVDQRHEVNAQHRIALRVVAA